MRSGSLARHGYGLVTAAGVMVVFALIKFALIEVPVAGYTINSHGAAARVRCFSDWLHANQLVAIALIVGVFSIVLIGRGVSGLA